MLTLDEPTSGLHSFDAQRVVTILQVCTHPRPRPALTPRSVQRSVLGGPAELHETLG